MAAPITSVADYVAALPEQTRAVVEELRRTIHAVLPEVGETIRYGMPTFTLDGGSLVHLAAWTKHIALYPLPRLEGSLGAETEPYRGAKDAMRLPLAGPVPYDLVGRLVAEMAARHRSNSR